MGFIVLIPARYASTRFPGKPLSDIAGKPMAVILGGRLRNATVTWCHRHTHDLADICRESDLVVSCAGVAPPERTYLITADMIKPGACVIDVGFRRIGPGRGRKVRPHAVRSTTCG